ncbi:unnamed protein product [Somion occarium]|uniref:SAP domain-containing protein n=1 Tax=Somion occarium TaxID=3059160 RepID=A0ABP1D9K9_9APHY
MLRTVLKNELRPLFNAQGRSFVSTVLLTRSWENESVSNLKKEARERGISQKGNKATLITRLQQHDKQRPPMRDPSPTAQAQSPVPSSPVTQYVRKASTTEVPGVPSSAEPPRLPPNFPKDFLDVKIPVPSDPLPEPTTPIPFVPDFWDSARVKAASAPPKDEPDHLTLIAVAGDPTHIAISPAYNLYIPEEEVVERKDTSKTTFLEDVAEDLYIPTLKRAGKEQLEKLQKADLSQVTGTSKGQVIEHSRPLDKEEMRGLYLFFAFAKAEESEKAGGKATGAAKH